MALYHIVLGEISHLSAPVSIAPPSPAVMRATVGTGSFYQYVTTPWKHRKPKYYY